MALFTKGRGRERMEQEGDRIERGGGIGVVWGGGVGLCVGWGGVGWGIKQTQKCFGWALLGLTTQKVYTISVCLT